MARKELKDKNKEKRDALENEALRILTEKLEILKIEKELKKKMDLTPLEPKYKFETDPKWIEQMRKGHLVTTDEQILMINQKIYEIEASREIREEQEKQRV